MRRASLAALVLAVACGNSGAAAAGSQAPSDSATMWVQRAQTTPEIASWLYLRAAAATRDSAGRFALYAQVTLPVARDRIPWVEAAALETTGDTVGALRAYQALPAPVTVLRLRAALAGTTPRADSVRHDIVAFISAAETGDAIREAYTLFDRLVRAPTADEQLTIARAAARVGQSARARAGYASVPGASLTPEDRFAYADALARGGASDSAAVVYGSITAPASLAAAARYQHARAQLSAGNGTAARTTLRMLASGNDTSSASALALLADLSTDDGSDPGARALLLQLVRRFPTSRLAPDARFDAALIALILGQATTAVRELTPLAKLPSHALEAGYWLGRAQQAAGNTAAARAAWSAVLARDSTSYYAARASARLHTTSLHPVAESSGYPEVASVDSAVTRIRLLRGLAMTPEAQIENDRLFRDAPQQRDLLLATASAFAGTDQAARAIALGRRALAAYGPSASVFRLIYPVAARDTIVAESRKAGIDPALVAALIRQESNFNPGATSAAGARGLMQVMPSVGREIAPGVGITSWNPALLYDPGINVELGVRHLAPLLRRQPSVERVLAAYNAGESRVTRWARRPGSDDPEMFTERIPFPETQDYVKSVLRNREFYRALYAW